MTVQRAMLGAATVLAALFVVDAIAVHRGWTHGIDHRLLTALRHADAGHSFAGRPWQLKLLVGLTSLGAAMVRVPVTIAAGLVLALRKRGGEAAMLAAAVAGGLIALPILKAVFDRPRPDLLWHLVIESASGFPSGHAMGSMILYPLLGFIAGSTRGVSRAVGLALAGVMASGLIGITRILLGVHWASDVLGGWLIGGAIAVAAAAVFPRPVRAG